MQVSGAIHVGVGNLDVVRQVVRLLGGVRSSCPAELVHDGDLVMLIGRIFEQRRRGTVRVTEVKGHADQEMVQAGRVRDLDRIGNNAADDFGRQRVDFAVIDARRDLSDVCGRWYPVLWIRIASLLPSLGQWSIVMVVRVLPLILSSGLLVLFARGVVMLCCLAQLSFGPLIGSAFILLLLLLRILVKWVTFLGTLDWPAAGLI